MVRRLTLVHLRSSPSSLDAASDLARISSMSPYIFCPTSDHHPAPPSPSPPSPSPSPSRTRRSGF